MANQEMPTHRVAADEAREAMLAPWDSAASKVPTDVVPTNRMVYVITTSEGRDKTFKVLQYTLMVLVRALAVDGWLPPGAAEARQTWVKRFTTNVGTIRNGRALFNLGRWVITAIDLYEILTCETPAALKRAAAGEPYVSPQQSPTTSSPLPIGKIDLMPPAALQEKEKSEAARLLPPRSLRVPVVSPSPPPASGSTAPSEPSGTAPVSHVTSTRGSAGASPVPQKENHSEAEQQQQQQQQHSQQKRDQDQQPPRPHHEPSALVRKASILLSRAASPPPPPSSSSSSAPSVASPVGDVDPFRGSTTGAVAGGAPTTTLSGMSGQQQRAGQSSGHHGHNVASPTTAQTVRAARATATLDQATAKRELLRWRFQWLILVLRALCCITRKVLRDVSFLSAKNLFGFRQERLTPGMTRTIDSVAAWCWIFIGMSDVLSLLSRVLAPGWYPDTRCRRAGPDGICPGTQPATTAPATTPATHAPQCKVNRAQCTCGQPVKRQASAATGEAKKAMEAKEATSSGLLAMMNVGGSPNPQQSTAPGSTFAPQQPQQHCHGGLGAGHQQTHHHHHHHHHGHHHHHKAGDVEFPPVCIDYGCPMPRTIRFLRATPPYAYVPHCACCGAVADVPVRSLKHDVLLLLPRLLAGIRRRATVVQHHGNLKETLWLTLKATTDLCAAVLALLRERQGGRGTKVSTPATLLGLVSAFVALRRVWMTA